MILQDSSVYEVMKPEGQSPVGATQAASGTGSGISGGVWTNGAVSSITAALGSAWLGHGS